MTFGMEKLIGKQSQEKMRNRKFMKRLYSSADFYHLLREMLGSMKDMRCARRKKLINSAFGERIMMAVTEVNGCRYCSYFHTQVALEAGLQVDEIRNTLAGDFSQAPQDELIVLVFAQHYADSAGKPQSEALQRLYDMYGEEKSRGILAYIRAIMVGNAWGNAFDSLRFRILGKPNLELNMWQEITVVFSPFFMLPALLVERLTSEDQ